MTPAPSNRSTRRNTIIPPLGSAEASRGYPQSGSLRDLVSVNKYETISPEEIKDLDLPSDYAHAGQKQHSPPMVDKEPLPSVSSPDDKEKLSHSLTTLIEFCTLYGFDERRFLASSRKTTLLHWQQCSAQCGWMKFLKYKTSAFFSNYLEVELPAPPFTIPDDPSQLAGGALGRFIQKMLRSSCAPEFATGILYLKKGLPRPGEKELQQAVHDTTKKLTSRPSLPHSPYCDFFEFKKEISRTVREIFGRVRMTRADLLKPYAPSIKANYVNSRFSLGTFGTLRAEGFIAGKFESDVAPPVLGPNVSTRDRNRDLYYHALERETTFPSRPLVETPLHSVIGGPTDSGRLYIDDSEVSYEGRPALTINPLFRRAVEGVYANTYNLALEGAKVEKANVILVPLAESLKTRVISKGPPLTYFVLKPVQKFLHSIMRKHNVFRYIGRPVDWLSLSQIVTPAPRPENDDELENHSVDYADATNGCDPYWSNHIMKEINLSVLRDLPDIHSLTIKSLTGHKILNLSKLKTIEDFFRQLEDPDYVWSDQLCGQLMGAILSFIVLCIYNVTICRLSLEKVCGYKTPLRAFPGVINGDDALIRASPTFRAVWSSIAASVGLEPSLGKTYSHPVYANINSTSFEYDSSRFNHIPYVNMGLVKGLKRSGGKAGVVKQDDEDDSVVTLGAIHRDLMDSCPWRLRPQVHLLFLKENGDRLKKVRVPWYVPESLGGVGLAPVSESLGSVDNIVRSFGPSSIDESIAIAFKNRVPGLLPKQVPASQPIQARDAWVSRIPYRLSDYFLSEEDRTFLDLSTYYLVPSVMSVAKPFDKTVLRHNERAWALAYHRKAAVLAL